ncbi:MAG: DegV family EDD domain-containing protein [Firmicutes bacterium]|nr:DegV family EDD domain-containing protein [Bacillota bacterium]
MSKKIVLVAETGSDITPQLAQQLGVLLVPMHVSIGEDTLDDGTFPPEDVCAYYDKTGKVPKTSASTPNDFAVAFDAIRATDPQAEILHLAYSAVTTCSYASAVLAAEGRNYVKSVDTKQVSIGQSVAVQLVAEHLQANPDIGVEDLAEFAQKAAASVHMSFIPKNLDYLRAGGRVSNVVALTGNLLGLHPCIEIIDGKLLAKKKYRGSLIKVVPKLIEEQTEQYQLDKERLWFIESCGLPEEIKQLAEETARALGYKQISWNPVGCVITCHGGPSAFGLVGISK